MTASGDNSSFRPADSAGDQSWGSAQENTSKPPKQTVAQLKSALKKREAEFKDLQAENKRLKADLAQARNGTAQMASGMRTLAAPMDKATAREKSDKLKSAFVKMLKPQMVYKPSLKGSIKGARLVAEVPDVPESVAASFLGKAIKPAAKIVKTGPQDKVFIDLGYKSLRYGSHLSVDDGFTASWARDGGVLKVSGMYTMK